MPLAQVQGAGSGGRQVREVPLARGALSAERLGRGRSPVQDVALDGR